MTRLQLQTYCSPPPPPHTHTHTYTQSILFLTLRFRKILLFHSVDNPYGDVVRRGSFRIYLQTLAQICLQNAVHYKSKSFCSGKSLEKFVTANNSGFAFKFNRIAKQIIQSTSCVNTWRRELAFDAGNTKFNKGRRAGHIRKG